jgi:hypothetical protein
MMRVSIGFSSLVMSMKVQVCSLAMTVLVDVNAPPAHELAQRIPSKKDEHDSHAKLKGQRCLLSNLNLKE